MGHALEGLAAEKNVGDVFKGALVGLQVNGHDRRNAALGLERGQAMDTAGIDKGKIPRLKPENLVVLRDLESAFQGEDDFKHALMPVNRGFCYAVNPRANRTILRKFHLDFAHKTLTSFLCCSDTPC